MANVGDGISATHGGWSFGGDVAVSFDNHVSKSVPLYNEGHELICNLSDYFVKDDSLVYEIGCSTGSLIAMLSAHSSAKLNARFVGIDLESGMIDRAIEKYQDSERLHFVLDDVLSLDLNKSDLIVCYYTIQFIRPSLRQGLIDKIYKALNWGGALILFEKVRGADARFQDILTTLYQEYKLSKGYTADDIVGKTRSLKGVLEPFSTQGNIDMLKRAGFVDINTVQKYLCFEGFLAIK